MINKLLSSVGSVLAMLLLAGCIESATVVQVEKDGSGVLLIRDFISPQALSMMDGFEEMAAELETAETMALDVEGWDTLTKIQQSMLRSRVEEFGETVRLVAVESATNASGWSGYRARLAFNDLHDLNLALSMDGDDDDDGLAAYELAFTPGDVAELRIIPQVSAADDEAVVPDTLDLEDDDFGGMMEGMDEAMMEMFRPMFAGMRMSLFVEVVGEIVETDASHQSAARPNRIALVDVDFDQLLKHPGALAKMSQNQTDGLHQLQAEGISGVLLEDPEKTITIRFK